MTTSNDIHITANPTTAANVCVFELSKDLLPGSSLYCQSAEEAQGSPLLEALFQLGFIDEVIVAGHRLNIKKNTQRSWQELGASIGQCIRQVLSHDPPYLKAKTHSNDHIPTHTNFNDLEKKVLQVLQEQVAPSLAAHGGTVELIKVEASKAFLNFGGGCQGCSQVSLTVKQGVEQLLVQAIPEIESVVDITDHSAGENPYFE